jgi:hypothetical protein
MPTTTYLTNILEKLFDDVKQRKDPNEGKFFFGKIWTILAGKCLRINNTEISLSWRQLSAELAILYNKWYNGNFTTDAFLKAGSPDFKIGDDENIDSIIEKLAKIHGYVGIFKIKPGPSISYRDKNYVFSETDIVTGEVYYYAKALNGGKQIGEIKRIDKEEFENICFSTR